MKTKLLLSALLTFSFLLSPCTAQVPQGFNYQAIARDGSGNPITGATIKVKLSVLSDTTGFYASGSGAYIWEEEHLNVKTNSFGLFTVVFGDISATKTLGTVNSFSAIDWSQSPLFIGTKIANPTTYKNLGSAKLWSVPYSMITAIADSTKGLLTGSKLSVVSSNDLGTDALFEVKRKDGQTVFAVYPDAVNVYLPTTGKGATKGGFAIGSFGSSKAPSQNYLLVKPDTVRIFIDDTPGKASKGGFAIGGFGTSKTPSQHLFEVNPDSIRAYIDTNPGKGVKGGFAIGGFGSDKAPGEQYLRVTRDSTRVYVNESEKGVKGGFAIGSISGGKGDISNFLDLTPENYFIGEGSGKNNTTGMYNSFIGYQSGDTNTTGSNNVFLGYQSGSKNDNGSKNVFIGYESGSNNLGGIFDYSGNNNVFIGSSAGFSNTTGYNNTFLGDEAGYNNNTGVDNVFLGDNAGYENTTGLSNVFLGQAAGKQNIDGQYNIFIGTSAGENQNTFNASRNIFLGMEAGNSNLSGSDNIFIGTWSGGGTNTSGSSNICIGTQSGFQGNGTENIFIGNNSGRYSAGTDNLFLGSSAGYSDAAGSGNVFVGYNAGYNETGSNKLYIANSNVAPPLIYGDFSSELIGIGTSTPKANLEVAVSGTSGYAGIGINSSQSGGKLITLNQGTAGKLNITVPGAFDLATFDFTDDRVGIGTTTPGYTLHVNGSVAGIGTFVSLSDKRFKKDVQPIIGALDKIMALQGITFNWDKTSDPELNVDDKNHIGFAAQDIEKILPQVVSTAADKMQTKSVAYGDVVPVLVEAIKEQQKQIEILKTELERIKVLLKKEGNN